MDSSSLYELLQQVLSGGSPASVQQPSAPVPPASAGSGAGSMYGALDPAKTQAVQNSFNGIQGRAPASTTIDPGVASALSNAFGGGSK